MAYHPILDRIIAELPPIRRETPAGAVLVEVAVGSYDHAEPRVRVGQARVDRQGRAYRRRSITSLAPEDARQLARLLIDAADLIGGYPSMSTHLPGGAGQPPAEG